MPSKAFSHGDGEACFPGMGGGGGGGGGGGNVSYKPYSYMPPPKVWILGIFFSENGYRLCSFYGRV